MASVSLFSFHFGSEMGNGNAPLTPVLEWSTIEMWAHQPVSRMTQPQDSWIQLYNRQSTWDIHFRILFHHHGLLSIFQVDIPMFDATVYPQRTLHSLVHTSSYRFISIYYHIFLMLSSSLFHRKSSRDLATWLLTRYLYDQPPPWSKQLQPRPCSSVCHDRVESGWTSCGTCHGKVGGPR